MKTRFVFLFLIWMLAAAPDAGAQTADPSFERLEQMLQRMQEDLMRGFQRDTSGRWGDTQFFFRMDTLGGGSDFFNGMQVFPFDDDSSGGFMDFEQFFRQMDEMSGQLDRRYFQPGAPSDDGALREAEGADELLPFSSTGTFMEAREMRGKTAPDFVVSSWPPGP